MPQGLQRGLSAPENPLKITPLNKQNRPHELRTTDLGQGFPAPAGT
jgi:hypothetical protein